MIGKAKAISHGIGLLEYITGESSNKKHPELIRRIHTNLMPAHLDAQGMWDSMKLTLSKFKLIKNSVIRVEVSPAKEYTENFTDKDWKDLAEEFLRECDRYEKRDENGNLVSGKTNLSGSKYCACVHFESESGIPHLHIAVCRVDENGKTNNDHMIHERAQKAAEKVAIHRGWVTAMEKHEINVERINEDCYSILRNMSSWSWSQYVAALKRKGYDVKPRQDSKGRITGYAILLGESKYNASKIGRGRNLMFSKLQQTWQKMHEADRVKRPTPSARPAVVTPARLAPQPPTKTVAPTPPKERPTATVKPVIQPPQKPAETLITKPLVDYTRWVDGSRPVSFRYNGEEYKHYIPEKVAQFFDDEFDHREVANWQPLTHLACALFTMIDAATTITHSSGGGGGQSESGWGRKKDEDDMAWARRCAAHATGRLGRRKKGGMHL